MFNLANKKANIDKEKERITMFNLLKHLQKKYNTKNHFLESEDVTAVYTCNNQFDIVFTICDTDFGKRIKIEDFIINEKHRNKGIGSKLMNEITSFCKKSNCIVGLWCEKSNTKAYKFYINNGFKHIDTKDDHWLEYR